MTMLHVGLQKLIRVREHDPTFKSKKKVIGHVFYMAIPSRPTESVE